MEIRPIDNFLVTADRPISEVVASIDRSGRISIALVIDAGGRLVNTLSDGDVRRGLLAGFSLIDPASKLLAIKAKMPNPVAVTALLGTTEKKLLATMQRRGVRQIPLVDSSGIPKGIVILSDLLPQLSKPLQAVVMAGGFGKRLMPLTENTPKPMLPISGKPVLEHIVNQLRNTGIRNISISTHYHPEKITSHFGSGADFGVNINYLQEDTPLGTGGALGLMQRPQDPLLIINGDILTEVDFQSLYSFHQDNQAAMTVCVRRYEVKVPYGVVDCEEVRITGLREKPELSFFVNAGIYLIEPTVHDLIPINQYINMTDLIQKLIEIGSTVVSYPICEYWLDIGQHDDYKKATADATNGELHL